MTTRRQSLHEVIVARLRAAGSVFAEDEAALLIAEGGGETELERMVSARVEGTPLEHILGWVEFCGRRFAVEPGVFVPRQRTEFMVEVAARLVDARPSRPPVVLDLCCGSGAIGAALARRLPGVDLWACDVDPLAVHNARRNIRADRVFEGDLFSPLPAALRGRVDVIVANTPYVPTREIRMMPPEARMFEARVALDGGDDGLDVQRRVAAEASDWLSPGGWLIVETSAEQAESAVAVFTAAGLDARAEHSDESYATVVVGTRAPVADRGRL